MSASDDDVKESKKEIDIRRGQRLKTIRSMTGLTAADLASKAGLSRVIISYWENATTGLSEHGAAKVIAVARKLGIDCEIEWLWDGKGDKPRFAPSDEQIAELASSALFPSIEKEIALFSKLNANSVILKVESAEYWPFFDFNDIVGGRWQPIDTLRTECYAIININDENKIKWIKSANNSLIQISNFPQKYHKTNKEEIELENFAPISRIWRA